MDHQYRQRPPSARPGTRQQQSRIGTTSTTQRRPKTAGRNSERPFTPSSNSFGPIPPSRQMSITPQTASGRPQSRIGMVANSIVSSTLPPSRSGSRIGTTSIVGTPGTAFGNRLNRSTTSMGQRPGTIGRQMIVNQIPLGTAQQRPITQQGVSGARAAVIASRMGSNRIGTSIGGGRMIADTNYYLGLLHNKLNILDNELINLNTELNKAEKGKKNLLIYEQKAEEQAQELKQLQGLLADYNLIIDRQNTHSNTNLRSLDSEAEQIALTNQKLMVEVEELFNERRLREEQVQELEQRTERLKNENNERMRILEKEIKEEFEQVNIEVENLRNEMERKKIELAELTKNKEEMDMALANSPFKRQTMLMEEQLQELNNKRTQIIDELNSKETPEEQRDNFIQKIQKDNKEIGNMQEQLQEINERMSQAQEELQEFQNEFELLAGDKSEKFRELKNRGAQMDNFLDNFDESKKQIEERINILSRQIIRQLQLISLNCRHGEIITNITGLDESLLALGSSSYMLDYKKN
ncbi:hypothetical protein Mgra_00006296 [Meloidogyne graminicola]|uniref:Intraflagellar transport protein 74 homolog n=1 Tax=Meloidogyne graminicola TaxID=189291 RepID=A0A8S9ZLV0_9BILA|nr:hypothetical protein Mgra_00006296 [Meloidogyne graminicola]